MRSVKVGDKLAFRYRNHWQVCTVTRITPTGRFKCGGFTLNPDLTVRGPRNLGCPTRGEEVTEAVRNDILRYRCLLKLRNLKWSRLSTVQLVEIMHFVDAAEEAADVKQGKEHETNTG